MTTAWTDDETGGTVWSDSESALQPIGAGAISETTQDALQRLPHSEQYSTVAHFNTAQAALTGSFGIKNLRMGTGNGTGITLPSSEANKDHYIYVASNTFNGTINPILVYGYNPGRPNTSEPSLYSSIEGDYNVAGTHYMEKNLDYVSSDGGTSKRFLEFQLNRTTHLATWIWSGLTFHFAATHVGTPYLFLNSTTLSLGNQSPSASTRIEINGTQNSATTEWGIKYQGAISTVVTNGLVVFGSTPQTIAAAFTVAQIVHFYATDATKGAGSTITSQVGYRCADLTTGSTNIAFKGEVSSGANKYNLHMDGTAQNYLAGVTGIGIAASATAALTLAASVAGVASLRVPHGTAPSSPVNGDIWTTTTGLFVRVNGATVGPLS